MDRSFNDRLAKLIFISKIIALEEKLNKKVTDREKTIAQLHKEIDELKERLDVLEEITNNKWRVGIYG